MDPSMFRQDVDNIAYAPRILQPSNYFKVRSKNKREREFDKLFLAQELRLDDRPADGSRSKSGKGEVQDQDAVWAMSFSRDGRYLAAAGQNHVVKIWSVFATADERDVQEADEDESSASENSRIQMKAPVFRNTPVRVYHDHEGPVLDMTWSKNNFLLTTSQDRTVRLFHPSREECLCTFKHSAQVHAVVFHPNDDRFFLAGCKDSKLRLWSIPDKRVEYWANVNDMVTAVAFSPDGRTAMAGTMNGSISIYATEGLKYSCQFVARGKKKSRVTSIEARNIPQSSTHIKLLVTTTDSRIQLYNLRDKGLELKLKGHRNEETAMRASINDDGRYIVCGSEDKGVYIWSLADSNDPLASEKNRDKTIQLPMEFFEANTTKTTCAILAPRETRVVLNGSGDPIYDVCNPPPVKLVEREDSIASVDKLNSSTPSINGINQRTPIHTKSLPIQPSPAPSIHKFDEPTPKTATSTTFPLDDAQKSTAYQIRALHIDGHILVTASTSGVIRVFRQDCATAKRSKMLDLDPSARRAYLRRAFGTAPSSLNSTGPNSARPGSVRSFKIGTPSVRSFGINKADQRVTLGSAGELVARPRRTESTASSQPARDRIERWREDIDGRRESTMSVSRADSMHSATSVSMVTANESPVRPRGTPSSVGDIGRVRADSGATMNSAGVKSNVSGRPTPSTGSPSRRVPGPNGTEESPDRPGARRGSSYANPLRLQGGQSFMFWNTSQYENKGQDGEKRPGTESHESRQSVTSRLTSEGSEDRLHDDSDDADDEEIPRYMKKCPRCGGNEFTIKESRGWSFGKVRSVVCQECGLERKDSG